VNSLRSFTSMKMSTMGPDLCRFDRYIIQWCDR
jgi:hypothetical protein